MRRGARAGLFIMLAAAGVLALIAGGLLLRAPASYDPTTTIAPPPRDSPSGRDYLNGAYADPPDTATPEALGAPWDYTINNSYQDNCRGCGVSGLAGLGRYPVIIDLHHVQSSYPDFVMAARGGYDADYQRTARQLVPFAAQIYAVRIDSEFNGAWSAASPFAGSHIVVPALWIAGFRRLAIAVRAALPEARLIWNPNIGQHDPFPYYPGDDIVDLIGPDIYCQPAYFSDSATCWNKALHGDHGLNLDTLATFAQAHHKPIIVPEWGDAFGDGTMIRRMRDWMDQNHVVAQSYWDSGDALSRTASLSVLTINQRAYVEAFGQRPYIGRYWRKRIPVPATIRPH